MLHHNKTLKNNMNLRRWVLKKKYLRGHDCKRQTKTRPEIFWFLIFIHHLRPIGKKSHRNFFCPISTMNGKVMAILIFDLIAGLSLKKNENWLEKPQKWVKFDEISYTASLYSKKTFLTKNFYLGLFWYYVYFMTL